MFEIVTPPPLHPLIIIRQYLHEGVLLQSQQLTQSQPVPTNSALVCSFVRSLQLFRFGPVIVTYIHKPMNRLSILLFYYQKNARFVIAIKMYQCTEHFHSIILCLQFELHKQL